MGNFLKLVHKYPWVTFFSAAISLTACQTTSSVNLASINSSLGTPSFVLQDNRPDKQKKSYDEFDAVGKNSHFGDDKIKPTAPELLGKVLQQKGSKELAGKTIILTDFLVIITNPNVTIDDRQLDAALSSVPNGVAQEQTSRLVIYGIESSMGKRNVYVRITGTLEGKGFSSYNAKNFLFGVSEANLKEMINTTLLDAASELIRK